MIENIYKFRYDWPSNFRDRGISKFKFWGPIGGPTAGAWEVKAPNGALMGAPYWDLKVPNGTLRSQCAAGSISKVRKFFEPPLSECLYYILIRLRRGVFA